MRRRLRTLILYLIAGVIVTFAVAWVDVLSRPLYLGHPSARGAFHRPPSTSRRQGLVYRRDALPNADRVISWWAVAEDADSQPDVSGRFSDPPAAIVPRWAVSALADADSPRGSEQFRLVEARGWPFTSLAGAYRSSHSVTELDRDKWDSSYIGAIPLPDRDTPGSYFFARNTRLLPLTPVWPGFVLDVLAFAAGLFVLRFATVGCLMTSWHATWRQRSSVALAAVVLGFLSTLGAAWGVALWEPSPARLPNPWTDPSISHGVWVIYSQTHPGGAHLIAQEAQAASSTADLKKLGLTEAMQGFLFTFVGGPGQSMGFIGNVIHTRGWPFPAMWSGVSFDLGAANLKSPPKTANGVFSRPDLSSPFPQDVASLPIGIIPAGFAMDVAAFGGLWMVVILSLLWPRMRTQRRRARTGQCAHCGYPVGASEVCTECGRPVTPCEQKTKMELEA